MTELALVFHGPITAPATVRLRNALTNAASGAIPVLNNKPCEKVYLLISSSGGNMEDGFSLFNLMRTVNMPITAVNMGQIASAANIVFLGGSHRVARPESYFFFHDIEWTFNAGQQASPSQVENVSQLLDIGLTNMKALFKTHTKLTDADFESFKFMEKAHVMNASAAKDKDIVQEVVDFKLPAGVAVLNVDY